MGEVNDDESAVMTAVMRHRDDINTASVPSLMARRMACQVAVYLTRAAVKTIPEPVIRATNYDPF